MNKEELKAYDARFVGKMNPRNTFRCFVCNKYYNGTDTTTLMISDDGDESKNDCMHRGDLEINETIYNAHIADLKANGLLGENDDDFLTS